jgi:hypothetical protein
MSPCSACSNAVKKLEAMFPNIAVNIHHGVIYNENQIKK